MARDKKKIIRACTVPQSFGFCREIMIRMREMGYEFVAVSSSGEQLDQLHDEDGFKTIAVPMARRISLFGDIKSLWNMIKVFRKEKPYMVHSMTPKAGLMCALAGKLTGVPVRVHTFTGLVWPTSKGLKRQILKMTDRITCACATHVITEVLAASDYVAMSSHFEGLSLASLEGLSSGKLFLASDVDGLHEIVDGSGILFPHEDAKAFADAIKSWIPIKKLSSVAKQKQYNMTFRRWWMYMIIFTINCFVKND